MAEKRIEFKAIDSGLSNMMNRMREDSRRLSQDMIKDAQSFNETSKEQIGYIDEQIRSIERRNKLDKDHAQYLAQRRMEARIDAGADPNKAKSSYSSEIAQISGNSKEDELQTNLLRELIETIKTTAKEEISEDKKDVERKIRSVNAQLRRGESVDPETALKTKIQEDILATEGGSKSRWGALGGMSVGGVGMGFLGAQAWHGMMGGMGRTASAQTGAEVITPFSAMMGGLTTSVSAGLVSGGFLADAGAEVGAQMGAAIGSAFTRHIESSNQLQSEQFGLRSLFGGSSTSMMTMGRDKASWFAGLGVDEIQATQLWGAAARASFSDAGTSLAQTRNISAIDRLTSLSQDELLGFLTTGRMIGAQSLDLSFRQAGGVNAKLGGSHQDLAELMRNQNSLIEALASVSDDVSRTAALSTLGNFERMGFRTSDPRSIQQITSIGQNLAQPKNAFMRAQNYAILRQLMPGADMFDIMRAESEGLNTPGFFEAVSKDIRKGPGSDSFKKMMMWQRFGGTGDIAERLFKGAEGEAFTPEYVESLKGFRWWEPSTGKTTRRFTSREDTLAASSEMTTMLQKQRAQITNAFIKGGTDGMKQVSIQFGSMIKLALDEAAAEFHNTIKEMRGETKVKTNKTNTAVQKNGAGSIFLGSVLDTIDDIRK